MSELHLSEPHDDITSKLTPEASQILGIFTDVIDQIRPKFDSNAPVTHLIIFVNNFVHWLFTANVLGRLSPPLGPIDLKASFSSLLVSTFSHQCPCHGPDEFLAMTAINSFTLPMGQYWKFLSASFLHGNALHLVGNMKTLKSGGLPLEKSIGSAKFLLIYVISTLAGAVLSAQHVNKGVISIGASTGISGVLVAHIIEDNSHGHEGGREVASCLVGMKIISELVLALCNLTDTYFDEVLQVACITAFAFALSNCVGWQAKMFMSWEAIAINTAANIFLSSGMGQGVDHYGHVGGMLAGAILSSGTLIGVPPKLDGAALKAADVVVLGPGINDDPSLFGKRAVVTNVSEDDLYTVTLLTRERRSSSSFAEVGHEVNSFVKSETPFLLRVERYLKNDSAACLRFQEVMKKFEDGNFHASNFKEAKDMLNNDEALIEELQKHVMTITDKLLKIEKTEQNSSGQSSSSPRRVLQRRPSSLIDLTSQQHEAIAKLQNASLSPREFVAKLTVVMEGSISKLTAYAEKDTEDAEVKKHIKERLKDLTFKDEMHKKLTFKSTMKLMKLQKSGSFRIVSGIPRSKLNFQNITRGPTSSITLSSLILIIAIFGGMCYRAKMYDLLEERLFPAMDLQKKCVHWFFVVFGRILDKVGTKEIDWVAETLLPENWIVVPGNQTW